MKKTVLTALNAKYFHTNLAVRCLKAAAGKEYNVEIVERTINDDMDSVLDEIISLNPDSVGFSCYIWNIEQAAKLAESVKKVLPDCYVFMGGPEVSYECEGFLKRHQYVDMLFRGEGELTFAEWIAAFEKGGDIQNIAGTAVRCGEKITINPAREERFDLNSLPFLYGDLSEYENRIIYYETSRGCPMNCSYCMSGIHSGMSYMDEKKAAYAFEYFLKNNVRQVKLVDRTFNFPLDRAKNILAKLINIKGKYPEAQTNFHFEITASIIDKEFINIIKKAPPGLIQFEAGVQSANPETLRAISRNIDTVKLLESIKEIVSLGNIAMHVDLIAGLPHEGYESFGRSFDTVYALGADKIHMGFLKLLKGSRLREEAGKYGIVYADTAPYKVLKTRDISYQEFRRLEKMEQLLELYKNSGNFDASLVYALELFPSPFGFYESFAEFAESAGFYGQRCGIASLYDMLYEFALQKGGAVQSVLADSLLYDWTMLEKPRRYPECIAREQTKEEKDFTRAFYNNRANIKKYLSGYKDFAPAAVSRMCHIAFFQKGTRAMLFDYSLPKKERAREIPLKES